MAARRALALVSGVPAELPTGDTLTASGLACSSASVGVGYAAGAGAAVTQTTSKSTAPPAINAMCGQITMNAAALAASTTVTFTVSNSSVAATDLVLVAIKSGNATAGTYQVWVEAIAAGSFKVNVRNISAGSLSEALVISFVVIKAVTA